MWESVVQGEGGSMSRFTLPALTAKLLASVLQFEASNDNWPSDAA